MRRLAIIACLVVAGCSSKKKACEHARDAIVAMTKADPRYIQDAPADMKELAEKRRSEDAQELETHFVDVCLELEDEHMPCIERVDEMVEAAQKSREAATACMSAGEPGLNDCLKAATNEREAAMGDCEDVYNDLDRAVYRKTRGKGP